MCKKPEYRKVGKYYKSSEQYWKMRNRRSLVLRLVEDEHLSQRQVAERLGVSERTVKRDVARVRPYYERKVRHQLALMRSEADEKFEAELAGKSLVEQLKILGRKMAERNKLMKMREYYRHQIFVSVDLDKVVYGFPEVRVWPQHRGAKFNLPITVNLRYIKDKKAIPIGSITVGAR